MLETLTPQPPDKIIQLSQMFRADDRADKIDLGVGVYKDAEGHTPIMRAVKAAERRLWDEETTKTYTAIVGEGGFHKAMTDLVLGDAVASDRLSYAHTPGGTGAVRQILELIKAAAPDATVWYSDPTWPNHPAIIDGVGLASKTSRHLDPESKARILDLLFERAEEAGASVLAVTHDHELLPRFERVLDFAQFREGVEP